MLASVAVCVTLFTVALRKSACASVPLADYIPTLQNDYGRRNDIVEHYFHLFRPQLKRPQLEEEETLAS